MRKLYVLFAVALALSLSTALFAHEGAQVYRVALRSLNDSGVTGHAQLILHGNQLWVILVARGLEPNMVHPQHIHGLAGSQDAVCPPPSAAGDDRLLTLEEGLPFYGPVLQPLDPFPMATNSKVNFNQTFTVKGDLLHLEDEVIVLHGMTVAGEYIPTLPIACGEIVEVSGGRD